MESWKKKCGSGSIRPFLKGQANAEMLKKNDKAIQIPQELGKCQLRSNRGEKQYLSSCCGLTSEVDKCVDCLGLPSV